MENLKSLAEKAKQASRIIAKASTEQKNGVIKNICELIKQHSADILKANQHDVSLAKAAGLSESMLDRLTLNETRLQGIIGDMQQVMHLPDPIGEHFEKKQLSNELEIVKCRTPLGVLGIIYESRPNVTMDTSVLAIKSGNCAILRGGSESFQTNQVFVDLIQEALTAFRLPPGIIQLVPSLDREQVKEMLGLHEYIDLIIPRGGAALHSFCRENSKIPVITGGMGVCHLFVDESADLEKSLVVVDNAKTQRPTVCNALDTVLVHRKAAHFIPDLVKNLAKKGCSFCMDATALRLINNDDKRACRLAQDEDWNTEWYSLNLGIKIVSDIDEAIQHIYTHSTGHSDGILTQSQGNAERFIKEIDSAAVYVNASTRFTDGGQLGLGAEVAISTQKIHARGPMGLQELTSYKWIIRGNYSVRP